MAQDNRPKKRGLYWARPIGYSWWPILVEVLGEVPYLRLRILLNQMATKNEAELLEDASEGQLFYSTPIKQPVIK